MSCMQCINSVKLSNYVGFEFLVIVQTIQNILYFGTENPEFLGSHIVQLSLCDSYNSLPDLDMMFLNNKENQEPEMNVTTFRAINEPKKSTNKFERINYNNDSSFDISTDTKE